MPVAQATESLQSLRAELAQAEQRQRTARNQLLSLMGLPAHDDRTLNILDRPVADSVEPSLEYGLAAAVQQRPELQVRQRQTSQAQA